LMENSRQGHVAQCKALGQQTHKCKCSHRLVAFFLSQCESY
jgi:mitochondrial fission protein ELM1